MVALCIEGCNDLNVDAVGAGFAVPIYGSTSGVGISAPAGLLIDKWGNRYIVGGIAAGAGRPFYSISMVKVFSYSDNNRPRTSHESRSMLTGFNGGGTLGILTLIGVAMRIQK